ncbi:ABC transporter ATP-binding protein [Paraburkholderia lycopersici]|uniref:Iron(III) transport system ATP-binding protein n=1 Tax=Paraburkholderia lycopersici TaxID=416944 RepID=A0A1G6XKZ8_9BURK|nr:ABC transporter ATP-binding protein [Paraburkholderia lycopersici]SDD78732.1 iron(III) transport system ATP-binding protein [Paraburkholderia lycopersici]
MSTLRISGLQKAFDGQLVLHDIDLAVRSGSLVALLGPSGSGKTTLLRVLCGFERADAGSIEIDGRRVAGDGLHLPTEQRRIGYVPQEGALFPHLTVAENIVFGLPRAQRRARHRVAELLELVGLPESYATRAPQQLSGGQQQRVALARALAPSPGLVMLDEPFSSLDAALRVETREAVAHALAAAGATAVLVTHDQAEALSLGHEVAVLWRGRLLQSTSPQALYRYPATRELAAFIGEAVLLPGTVANGLAHCALGALRIQNGLHAEDGLVDVMLRPEQIDVRPEAGQRDGTLGAVVRNITFHGQDAALTLQLIDADATVRARVPGYRTPREGERVRLAVGGEVSVYPR